MFSRWFRMLIFGLWFDCVLEGLNLPKNDVAIFFRDFFILFSELQITAQIVLNDWGRCTMQSTRTFTNAKTDPNLNTNPNPNPNLNPNPNPNPNPYQP